MAKVNIEPKKRIEEIKKNLLANSKDQHFTEELVKELTQNIKRSLYEPILIDAGKEVDSFKGETFEMVKTNKGVYYHTYGGYTIFVTPNNNALYELLVDYIDNKEVYNKLEDEERKNFELTLSAVTYCLNVPLVVFSDVNLTYKIATDIVSYLNNLQAKMLDSELQEETIEEDAQFKDATLALEAIKEEIAEERINEE